MTSPIDPMNPAFKGKRHEERQQMILLAILEQLVALNRARADDQQPRRPRGKNGGQ